MQASVLFLLFVAEIIPTPNFLLFTYRQRGLNFVELAACHILVHFVFHYFA